MSANENNGVLCTEDLSLVFMWVIQIVETCLALISLVSNSAMALVLRHAVPICPEQRRMMIASSCNFAFLALFIFSKSLFFHLSAQNPCVHRTHNVRCKIEQSPLFFCYLNNAILSMIISIQAVFAKRMNHDSLQCSICCGVWQSIILVISAASTLLFTAFDEDIQGRKMSKCFLLLAIRNTNLAFYFLSTVIVLNFVALLFIFFGSSRFRKPHSPLDILSILLRKVIITEGFLWLFSSFISGSILFYRHISTNSGHDFGYIILELSFVALPLFISVLHPILQLWLVFPIRDAALYVFPSLRYVLPEYELVPPPDPFNKPDIPMNHISERLPKIVIREQ